ncbi:hypothetical protein AGOR_G00054200 [Albula goreensis]|uniref:Uncharacterized protein n=1 Tax=Albula goreensis TaxID=1534307 RepID=A0A8T3DWU8_9TELE|nr:hypothetical protein AGOR_G00054200 [Albula goreensis]
MSTTEEVPAFFDSMGSGSPKPRQKFCGMFCPVEGSNESKTLDFDSLSVGRTGGKTDKRVIDKQRDISQPAARKIEIRRSAGKEALQNLNEEVRLCIVILGEFSAF